MDSRIDVIMTAPEGESPIDYNAPGLVPEPVPLRNDDVTPEVPEPIEHDVAKEPEAAKEAAKEPVTTDDYGMPVETKERVYTESEVQAMIRDRLSRGRQEPQPAPQVQQPQTQADPEDWQAQLYDVIDQRLSQRDKQVQEQQWQRQEQENQAQFEVRFNQGMSKYNDFEQVVSGKPLTPQMVIATRGMQDPAAFIYAAAKTQAPELERISRIQDPISQVVELGRLEERMRKSRASVSQAPRPIDIIKGDVPDKVERKWSIDDKLRQAENENRKDRMRGRVI
jgi:hypothetical protein